ncbi:similar to hypothetical protein MGC6696, isoform CRA_c [Rattus norvegicus]|uniref:Uncharacterized protein RGD1309471 n=1 Tax=Rattus norvegicus TaxID=10116 RepID=A6HZW6_RAT|nr:similar to hypothetical protein MGC6696, isoform CRA_c [Rattus norvegicus]EDM12747.1 similar to hypothetical protein MGC6696, isoform CRA_c [Rattus norvegicus]
MWSFTEGRNLDRTRTRCSCSVASPDGLSQRLTWNGLCRNWDSCLLLSSLWPRSVPAEGPPSHHLCLTSSSLIKH